jgi:transposase
MRSNYSYKDMLEEIIKEVKRRPLNPCSDKARSRMPLSTPQDTKKSIVICPSRAHTRIFWYQKPHNGGIMILIGIDWEDKGYTVRIIDEEGNDLSGDFEIERDKEGFSELIQKIREYSTDDSEVLIGIERERDPIVEYLLTLGFKVFLVCPNMIDSLRDRHSGSGQYTDELDSYVIADAVRTDRKRLTEIEPKSEKIRKVEFLLRHRKKAVEDKKGLTNRLTAYIKEYFPAFLGFFKDITCSTALSLLKAYPTYRDIKELSKEEIRVFLREHNYYREEGVNRIHRAIEKGQVKIDSTVIKERSRTALNLIKRIELLNKEIKEYETELEEVLKDDEDAEIFRSIPGSGDTLTPGLMVIFGKKRSRYENTGEINSLSGMVPYTKQSGNWTSHNFRFACNHFYRDILTRLAYCSLTKSEWAKDYYDRKKAEGKSQYHTLRCLGRLWVKIAFALWKKRQKYDEDKHMASVQRHRMRNKLTRKSA